MDTELAEVCSNPLPAELLGDSGGGAGADEEISDEVTLFTARLDHALNKRFRFLRWILRVFFRLRVNRGHVVPQIRSRNSGHLVKVKLHTRHPAASHHYFARVEKLIHSLFSERPAS